MLLSLSLPTTTFNIESIGIILSSAIAVKLFDVVYNEITRRRKLKLQAAAAHVSQSVEVRRIAIEEVDVVIANLQNEIKRLSSAHDQCTQSVNKVTIENLRFLARIRHHEWTINELEHKLGMPITDFGKETGDASNSDEGVSAGADASEGESETPPTR